MIGNETSVQSGYVDTGDRREDDRLHCLAGKNGWRNERGCSLTSQRDTQVLVSCPNTSRLLTNMTVSDMLCSRVSKRRETVPAEL